jgi:hypothetical protein
MTRIFIGIGSVCQFVLSFIVIVGGWDSPSFFLEILPFALFFAAGVLSLILAASDDLERRPVLLAVSINALAIGVYCLLPAFLGGESQEGFSLIVASGLIFLIVGLPAANSLLLLHGMTNTPMEITRVNHPAPPTDRPPDSN